MILAGGRGKRMRPITDYVPKPLVPIRNVPIIEWQIRHLGKFDISDIIVCTGYKTGMIEDYLQAKDYGMSVKVSVENTPLGTGGAIKQATHYINGDNEDNSFIVLNGDIITDIDISILQNVKNSIATIPLRTNYGILEFDSTSILTNGDENSTSNGESVNHINNSSNNNNIKIDTISQFKEKTNVPNIWMNAGIYHLECKVLDDLPDKGDIEKTVFPDYAKRGMLQAVKFERNYTNNHQHQHQHQQDIMWQSVDSFKDLEACSTILANESP